MQRTVRCGFTVLAIIACGGGVERTDDSAAASADSLAAFGQSVGTSGSLEPVALTESDVEHFVGALEELQATGLRYESRLGSDPSDATSLAEGFRGSAEAMAILRKHGFDVPRFQVVSYSVALAMVADQAAASAPEVNEAVAQVEKMKGQIPKEQYDAMLAGAQSAAALSQDMQKQPAGNVDVVKPFRERLERLGKER